MDNTAKKTKKPNVKVYGLKRKKDNKELKIERGPKLNKKSPNQFEYSGSENSRYINIHEVKCTYTKRTWLQEYNSIWRELYG